MMMQRHPSVESGWLCFTLDCRAPNISHHEPRFVLGRERRRPPIFTLFEANPKSIWSFILVLERAFKVSCHDYMMPTFKTLSLEKMKRFPPRVGFFGILSALIGLLGPAPPSARPPAKKVNKKCALAARLKTEQQRAENEWKIVVE